VFASARGQRPLGKAASAGVADCDGFDLDLTHALSPSVIRRSLNDRRDDHRRSHLARCDVTVDSTPLHYCAFTFCLVCVYLPYLRLSLRPPKEDPLPNTYGRPRQR